MSNLAPSAAATAPSLRIAGPRARFPKPIGHGGDVPRNDGWRSGSTAFDDCGIVRSANTAMGDVLADTETLFAARPGRASPDDIARQAQPTLPQHGVHHHE